MGTTKNFQIVFEFLGKVAALFTQQLSFFIVLSDILNPKKMADNSILWLTFQRIFKVKRKKDSWIQKFEINFAIMYFQGHQMSRICC